MIDNFHIIPFNELRMHTSYQPIQTPGKSNNNTALIICITISIIVISTIVIYKINQSKPEDHD